MQDFKRVLTMCVLTLTALLAFPAVAETTKKPETVMVYGDSLSAAYGIKPTEGWVSLMGERLKPKGVTVVNASISGETTAGGAARIKADLARHRPTVVVLALGANDGLRGLAVAEMRTNLTRMLDAIRATGARAVLVGIQIPPNYGIDYARQFRESYTDLAAARKLPLVPFLLESIAEDLANFQADRLHPTAAAQARILANVLPVVEKTLPTNPAAAKAH